MKKSLSTCTTVPSQMASFSDQFLGKQGTNILCQCPSISGQSSSKSCSVHQHTDCGDLLLHGHMVNEKLTIYWQSLSESMMFCIQYLGHTSGGWPLDACIAIHYMSSRSAGWSRDVSGHQFLVGFPLLFTRRAQTLGP